MKHSPHPGTTKNLAIVFPPLPEGEGHLLLPLGEGRIRATIKKEQSWMRDT